MKQTQPALDANAAARAFPCFWAVSEQHEPTPCFTATAFPYSPGENFGCGAATVQRLPQATRRLRGSSGLPAVVATAVRAEIGDRAALRLVDLPPLLLSRRLWGKLDKNSVRVRDFSGDGKSDILCARTGARWRFLLMNGAQRLEELKKPS